MNIGYACLNREYADPALPHEAVITGLRALGHTVMIAQPTEVQPFGSAVDAVFIWNGVHGKRRPLVEHARERGLPVFIMERGFFDRFNYTQIDHQGFNHRASWAAALHIPAPADGAARFAAAWGCSPGAFGPRDGYCLVLLQVPGDSQLQDSELHHPGPLVEAVTLAAPPDLPIRVKAHPLNPWDCGTQGRARMTDLGLHDAVAGAKFCVTINSNAGNEALAWGCPVLCFGPALYGMAGVARGTAVATLEHDIAEMCEGRRPGTDAVHDYLAHLACRQWSREELAAGWPLEKVLTDAAA